jgi:uncharacterized membrane protein YwaF
MLQGTLEITGMMALLLVLNGQPLSWLRAIKMGALFALIIFALRSLPGMNGIHTVISLAMIILIIWQRWKVALVRSIATAVLGMVLLTIIELVCNALLMAGLHLTPAELDADALLWCLIGLPQGLVMIFLAMGADKILDRSPECSQAGRRSC